MRYATLEIIGNVGAQERLRPQESSIVVEGAARLRPYGDVLPNERRAQARLRPYGETMRY